MKVAVVGGGGWGTAIAALLANKFANTAPKDDAPEIVLWVRSESLAAVLSASRINEQYLPGVILPDSLKITSRFDYAIAGAEYIVLATPSHAVRETASRLAENLRGRASGITVVSLTKGLETGTLKRMSEVISEEFPEIAGRLAVMSGPNHAEEVGRACPTATVVAAADPAVAEAVQDLFMAPSFRVYTNEDVIGVEVGGALKNIIALAVGIADGLGFGDNSKAALMTRGLAEICRLGVAMGARPITFAGLSGIGDLIATCTSRHSRNRRAGISLACGKSAAQLQAETPMVVEGIRAAEAAFYLSRKLNVKMPITNQVFAVLYLGKPPRDAVTELMAREKTRETEEIPLV